MIFKKQSDDEQTALWNGPAGRGWVEAQAMLDQMFQPIETLLVETASARSGGVVLDVGCGAGATTFAFARRVGPSGRCVGIDISGPMLAAAQASAKRNAAAVRFILADAQGYAFEPESFDLIASRFGVMFFEDPTLGVPEPEARRKKRRRVAVRRLAKRSGQRLHDDGRARRGAAAAEFPPRRSGAPGQFAFADRQKVFSILEFGGWSEIEIRAIDVICAFPAAELTRYLTSMGPVGRILQQADEHVRGRIIEAVRPHFDPYVLGSEVRFVAACWLVQARAKAWI